MNRSPQLPHIAHSSRLEAPHKKVLHVSASSTLHMGTPIPISCTWGHLKIRWWYCSQTHNRPKQFTVKGDKNLLVPDVIWDANYPTFFTKSSKAVAFTQSCVRSCDRPTGWAQVPLVPIQTYFRQAFLRDGIAPKAFLHPDLYTLRCAAALPGSLSHPPSYRQMQDWLDNICSSANPTGCFLSLHWLLGMYSLIIFYSNAFPRKWWGWLLFITSGPPFSLLWGQRLYLHPKAACFPLYPLVNIFSLTMFSLVSFFPLLSCVLPSLYHSFFCWRKLKRKHIKYVGLL